MEHILFQCIRDTQKCIDTSIALVRKHIEMFYSFGLPVDDALNGRKVRIPKMTCPQETALGHILILLAGMKERYRGGQNTLVNKALFTLLHEFELLGLEASLEHISIAAD